MEEKNVQNGVELNDGQLEQSTGGIDSVKIQANSAKCPKCGKELGMILMTNSKCPHCNNKVSIIL